MFRILIVEDDTELSGLFSKVLTKHGYSVICAENGKKALDCIETEYIDLIISDIMMPVMDGYETEADPHTVEVHIGRLRDRLRDNPDFEIVTMRGIGYKVVKK